MRALVLALAACAGPRAPVATDAVFGVTVDAALEGGGAGPTLRVTVSAPADLDWTLAEPVPDALTASLAAEREERVGDRVVTTRRRALRGPPGRYVIEGVCATVDGRDEPPACAAPLYLDLGVAPDRPELADIVEPPPTWPRPPLAWIAAGVSGLGALAAGLALLLRRREAPTVVPVPEEPAHVVAIRAWEAVRDDPGLSDFEKAQALSEVFRAYVEAALHFPARAWTTTETLAHLERLDALPKMNVPRARRLLRATDRVKYAEDRPGHTFFEDLEADLHGFIDATRPHRFGDGGAP